MSCIKHPELHLVNFETGIYQCGLCDDLFWLGINKIHHEILKCKQWNCICPCKACIYHYPKGQKVYEEVMKDLIETKQVASVADSEKAGDLKSPSLVD